MGLFKIYIFMAMPIMLGFKFHKLYQQLDEDITLLPWGCTICCNCRYRGFFVFFFFPHLFFFFNRTCWRIIYIKVTLKSSTVLLTEIPIYHAPNLMKTLTNTVNYNKQMFGACIVIHNIMTENLSS